MEEKSLDNLTTEEWGDLFPVKISQYDPNWPVLFKEEKAAILKTLSYLTKVKVEHFGSTAIPGMQSKDTIDILVEIPHSELFSQQVIDAMNKLGYHYFLQQGDGADYMVFGKGYNLEGRKEQTFHVHMSAANHPIWERIHFRDFLRKNPDVAMEYAELKIKLAKKFKKKRVDYRIAKTDFVTRITEKGKIAANKT